MMANPWERNAGAFDQPSSGIPSRRHFVVAPARSPRSYVEQRLADSVRDGVVAVAPGTILGRIAAAIEVLASDGHGNAASIYLTDRDMLALRAAMGGPVDCLDDVPVRLASSGSSKVYSKRGVARTVRKALPRHPASPPAGGGLL